VLLRELSNLSRPGRRKFVLPLLRVSDYLPLPALFLVTQVGKSAFRMK